MLLSRIAISVKIAAAVAMAYAVCAVASVVGISLVLVGEHSTPSSSGFTGDLKVGQAAYDAGKAMRLDFQLHQLAVDKEVLANWASSLSRREIDLAARELEQAEEKQGQQAALQKEVVTELHKKIAELRQSVARIMGMKEDEASRLELLRKYIGLKATIAAGGEPGLEPLDLDVQDLSDIGSKLSELETVLQGRIRKLEGIEAAIEAWRWGITSAGASAAEAPRGSPAQGLMTSGFGPRLDPVTGEPGFHTGIDVAVQIGTPVLATDDGLVTLAGSFRNYGLTVIIAHASGWNTLYGHCSSLLVETGESVQRGQVVCLAGNTGHSSGPHVHYEVMRGGRPVDPAPFLRADGR